MRLAAYVLAMIGVVFVIGGVAMAYTPAAFVLAGAALIAVGLLAIDWED